jgi:hypothetical protein
MDYSGLLWILLFDVVISGAAGGAIAYCAARVQRKKALGWWKTAVLSSLAFLVGIYGVNFAGFYFPSVTDAERYYGHPDYDGFAIAMLVSLVFELGRYFENPRKPPA